MLRQICNNPLPFPTGVGLKEHFTMVASANIFCIAIGYKNKANMKVAASNINIKIHHCFRNGDSWRPRDYCTAKNLSGLNTNLLLNNAF